ncbi:hypothetical protein [Macellibacteroides fermentans]|uniref:hypothetical protein n=1 Tax=Macellibacteroides fermentans TaxID=879969 RepID=UPI00406BFEFA
MKISTAIIHDNKGRPYSHHYDVPVSVCTHCQTEINLKAVSDAEKSNPYGFCVTCGLETAPTKYRINRSEKIKLEFPEKKALNVDMFCLEAYCPKCSKVYSKHFLWSDGRSYEGPSNYDDPVWYNHSQARLAESVERIDDAAMYYEKAGFLEKAKQLRIKNRNQVVHHITIDVNKLLNFLKESNFTIPYKCPSCHGTIKINGQRDAIKFFTCEYCGTSLQAIDVQNLINDMM